jgi:hypothetical protein
VRVVPHRHRQRRGPHGHQPGAEDRAGRVRLPDAQARGGGRSDDLLLRRRPGRQSSSAATSRASFPPRSTPTARTRRSG